MIYSTQEVLTENSKIVAARDGHDLFLKINGKLMTASKGFSALVKTQEWDALGATHFTDGISEPFFESTWNNEEGDKEGISFSAVDGGSLLVRKTKWNENGESSTERMVNSSQGGKLLAQEGAFSLMNFSVEADSFWF